MKTSSMEESSQVEWELNASHAHVQSYSLFPRGKIGFYTLL